MAISSKELPEPIKSQCRECDNDELYPIPGYPAIAECSRCGYPNDISDTSQEPNIEQDEWDKSQDEPTQEY